MTYVGEPITDNAMVGKCLYAPRAGDDVCGADPALHILGKIPSGEAVTLPACPQHEMLARGSLSEALEEHPYEESCASLITFWAVDRNICVDLLVEGATNTRGGVDDGEGLP